MENSGVWVLLNKEFVMYLLKEGINWKRGIQSVRQLSSGPLPENVLCLKGDIQQVQRKWHLCSLRAVMLSLQEKFSSTAEHLM